MRLVTPTRVLGRVALSAVTTEDAVGWFSHCGYRAQDQCL